MSSQDMSAEENRWFVFYRDSLWKVCLQDGIDFQQNFPSDMNTLHDFIENNYPIALFTLLQNADSITVTFVESALPLLLLSIQHIRYLLLQHDDSHPLHQWAYYKFEDIETYWATTTSAFRSRSSIVSLKSSLFQSIVVISWSKKSNFKRIIFLMNISLAL